MSKPDFADRDAARAVEEIIGHTFTDRSLFERALTHASVTASGTKDLERLEFLGDRVLGLLTAEALWRRFPDLAEGDLAPRLNAMVRKETCAEAARAYGLGAALHLSAGEERSGGREKDAILGDACEALLGALYLDGGLEAARRAWDVYWAPNFEALAKNPIDAKTALQEWAQERGLGTPVYRDVKRSGPDHAPIFVIEAVIGDLTPGQGEGKNKREAQMIAAEVILRREGVWDKSGGGGTE